MSFSGFRISVRVGDLLQACPNVRQDYESYKNESPSPIFPWSRFNELRRRWSHQVAEITSPVKKGLVPRDEIVLQYEMLSYYRCRSEFFWRVVGPFDITEELLQLPTAVWGGCGASLYPCQHEIPD